MASYSGFRILTEGLTGNTGWRPAWRKPEPKPAYDAIVIGGGGRLAASKLGNGTRNSLLGPMDRVLGLGFGAIKGLLAATLIYLVANLGTDVIWGGAAARPEWIGKSKTYPLLQASSRAIIDFVEQRRGDAIKSDTKNTKSTEGRAKDDA